MTKQTFIKGTIILVVAGLLNKVLGFVYRIALTRMIGDEGIGLFQMAFPILMLAITLATLGLNVAISKRISEASALRDDERMRYILLVSTLLVILTSIILTTAVIGAAPLIARYALTDSRAIYALLAIAPIIPVVSLAHVLRGYFQGRQNMFPSAASSVLEQIVRIFTVLFFATILLPRGVEFAAAGGMLGMVVGEFAGLCLMFYFFRKDSTRPRFRHSRLLKHYAQLKRTVRELFQISIPVTTNRLVGHIAFAIEPILVAQSLALAGLMTTEATSLYGQLAGMVIPLVYFPSFITHALSVSLVPAVSEAAAKNDTRAIHRRLTQSFRLSLIVGAPCAAIMIVLAEPLCELIYGNADAGHLMKIMAPFTLVWYLQGPLTAVLQGLDHASEALRNSLIGAVIKSGLIFILGSQPMLGIDGVVMAINTGIVVVTLLHIISITKRISFTIDFITLLKTGAAMFVTGWICYFAATEWFLSSPLWQTVLGSLICASLVYFLFSIWMGLIVKDDVVHIPYIGNLIKHLFPKK